LAANPATAGGKTFFSHPEALPAALAVAEETALGTLHFSRVRREIEARLEWKEGREKGKRIAYRALYLLTRFPSSSLFSDHHFKNFKILKKMDGEPLQWGKRRWKKEKFKVHFAAVAPPPPTTEREMCSLSILSLPPLPPLLYSLSLLFSLSFSSSLSLSLFKSRSDEVRMLSAQVEGRKR
jgi:hypothetical protein